MKPARQRRVTIAAGIAGRVRLGQDLGGHAQDHQARDHAHEARQQHRLASDAVDEPDRQHRHGHVQRSDGEVGVDRSFRAVADAGERGRRVVDDRVDAHQLLEHRKPDGHHERRAYPRLLQEAGASAVLLLIDLADLVDLLVGVVLRRGVVGLQLLEHFLGLVLLALCDEVARRLRHEGHSHQQDQRRYGRQTQHQAPVAGRGQDRVDDEGHQDADDDHELIEGPDGPTQARGRDLRQVERHHQRRAAHRQPEDHPCPHQGPRAGRRGGRDGPDGEGHRGDHDQAATAEGVGQRPRESSPGHGPEQQGGHHGALHERGQVEILGDEQNRAGDDAGVVAEQQPAQCPEEVDPASVRLQCALHAFPLARLKRSFPGRPRGQTCPTRRRALRSRRRTCRGSACA